MTDCKTEGWKLTSQPCIDDSLNNFGNGWASESRLPYPRTDAGPDRTESWTDIIPPLGHSAGDKGLSSRDAFNDARILHGNIAHQNDGQLWQPVAAKSNSVGNSGRTSNYPAGHKMPHNDATDRRDYENWHPILPDGNTTGDSMFLTSNTSASRPLNDRWGWSKQPPKDINFSWANVDAKDTIKHTLSHRISPNNSLPCKRHVSSSPSSQTAHFAQHKRTQTTNGRCALFLDVGCHW